MSEEPGRELDLGDIPVPPLFKLVDGSGEEVLQDAVVEDAPATVGALFASPDLAQDFSRGAEEYGMEAFAECEPRELADEAAVEAYVGVGDGTGPQFVLVVAETGTGLFHTSDVVAYMRGGIPFPLYLFVDEEGGSPLISVETGENELQVAPLFTTAELAHGFKSEATHLGLPELLGAIEDADGLRRHALVARDAGASYLVLDPQRGESEAIPVEEFI